MKRHRKNSNFAWNRATLIARDALKFVFKVVGMIPAVKTRKPKLKPEPESPKSFLLSTASRVMSWIVISHSLMNIKNGWKSNEQPKPKKPKLKSRPRKLKKKLPLSLLSRLKSLLKPQRPQPKVKKKSRKKKTKKRK